MSHKAEGGRRKAEGRAGRRGSGWFYALLPPFALVLCCAASAQPYPNRPVRIVVPSSPGGGGDFSARLIAPPLSERLGQQVTVDNRPGAATLIGTDHVAKSPPDGYTLLQGVGTLATAPAVYKKVPYDAQRDLAPITQMVFVALVLLVHPSLPAKSVKELVALAKARPGEIAFASSGTATQPHLSMELLLVTTGAKMLHVPYKGPVPGLLDLVAGRVSTMMTTSPSAFPHIRSGRVRVIGVTTPKRIAALPEVPTLAEAGVRGYESVQWWGILAPAGTPADIIARLNRDIVAVLGIPDIRQRLEHEGMEVSTGTPQAFGAYIGTEIEKWARVVKEAGIKPE